MNSPITTARLAMQAASVASQLAGRVGREVATGLEQTVNGFEQILQFSSPRGDERIESLAASSEWKRPSESKLQSMIDDAAAAVKKSLESIGITANPPIELAVQADGDVQVSNDHPDAARIEASISGNRYLLNQLRQIRSVSGVNRIIVSGSAAASA